MAAETILLPDDDHTGGGRVLFCGVEAEEVEEPFGDRAAATLFGTVNSESSVIQTCARDAAVAGGEPIENVYSSAWEAAGVTTVARL